MQSASSSCFSLGSTSCKTNSTSQFGHKIFLKLFAACFLKQSFHYLEETFRDTLSNLSLIKTNIRPGQARYISALFSSCFCLAQAPAGNGHSKASSLELPLFEEVLAVLGGKNATQKTKRGSPRWMDATSAKRTRSSMALLSNLVMGWEGRREDVHLDKGCVNVQSLLVLEGWGLIFRLCWTDWESSLPRTGPKCMLMHGHVLMAPGLRRRQQGFLLQVMTRHTNVISCEGYLKKVPKKPQKLFNALRIHFSIDT